MTGLGDKDLMPFGKHRGTKMIDVPASYLIWLYEQSNVDRKVWIYISDNIDVLRKEVSDAKGKN